MCIVLFPFVLCLLSLAPEREATLYDSQNITLDFIGMNEEDAINLLLEAGYNIVKSTYETGG